MADTFNKVVEIISERLGKDASTITENSKFREDLGADSLEVVELIMQLEDEFEIPEKYTRGKETLSVSIEPLVQENGDTVWNEYHYWVFSKT